MYRRSGGTIDVDELEDALVAAGATVNHDDLTRMMNDVDPDGEGEIAFPEFVKIMKQISAGGGHAEDEAWLAAQEHGVKVEVRKFRPGAFHGEAALDRAAAAEYEDEWHCKARAQPLVTTACLPVFHSPRYRFCPF